MNLLNIFNEIEKVDPEVYDRTSDRRAALKHFTGFAKKAAAVSMPFMLGSLFQKAYGQQTPTIVSVLNFALTLEYLESEFYIQAVNRGTALIPAADLPAFQTIRDHEVAHVNFLRTAIQGAGGTPVAKPTFDFTGNNGSTTGTAPFANVFTNYDTLLAISQAFEDTGVRAYKGQAANLMSNKDVLTAALRIHSVEARHAAHLRMLRKNRGTANNDPWITLANAGGTPAAIYAGEENTVQAGVQITNINGMAITAEDASEAFDEPLTMAQVLVIVDPFIV